MPTLRPRKTPPATTSTSADPGLRPGSNLKKRGAARSVKNEAQPVDAAAAAAAVMSPPPSRSMAEPDEEQPLLRAAAPEDGVAAAAAAPAAVVSPESLSWAQRNQWIVFALASGGCAAFNGVFAKLTTTELTTKLSLGIARVLGLEHVEGVVELVVRGSFFGLNLVFNGVMWTLFTTALARGHSTTQVSIMNTSTNFVITAILGFAIFSEALPPLWWIGAAMLVAGNVIIGSKDEGKSEAKGEAEGVEETAGLAAGVESGTCTVGSGSRGLVDAADEEEGKVDDEDVPDLRTQAEL